MAKVKSNDIIQGLSGRLGNQLVIRHLRDGRTIVVTRPDFSHRVFSPEQRSHQNRFRRAAAYARAAARANPLYAQLAPSRNTNAYNLALSDWFRPPVIQHVECLPGRMRIEVTDNVHVAGVQLTVCDEQGQVLEQGQAELAEGGAWEYASHAEGRVRVEAWDLAGNVAVQEIVARLGDPEGFILRQAPGTSWRIRGATRHGRHRKP